jgi:hypothetical protein
LVRNCLFGLADDFFFFCFSCCRRRVV